MKLHTLLLPAAAFCLLSACDRRDDGKEGTSFAVNAKGEDGNVAITADGKTGNVSVDVPGFNGNLRLPKLMLDHSNFDLDGVKLYPETKVRSITVDADDSAGQDKSNVRILFDSPAETAKVKGWFKAGFEEEDLTYAETPTGFTGKTSDGDSFSITLSPKGPAATSGTIQITG